MDKAALIAAVGTLASKVVEFLKYLRNKDWNGAVTLLCIWLGGVGAVALAAVADVTEGLSVPGAGLTFGQLDGGSVVFLGMSLLSFIAFIYDFKKAIDGSDSAKQPPLTKLPDGNPPA